MSNRRLHPDGYTIGGAHDKGLAHMSAGRTAARSYFEGEIKNGHITIEKNTSGRMRYHIIRELPIVWGVANELALRRAQHFLRTHENKWTTKKAFLKEFQAIYDNFIDAFKTP